MNLKLNKSATVFIYDKSGAYGPYLAYLLKNNFIKSDLDDIGKKPYFILETEAKCACQSILTFAKNGDNLVIIGESDQTLIRSSEKSGLNLLTVSGADQEIFIKLKEIGDYMANGEAVTEEFNPPFPLGLSHSCFTKEADEKEFKNYKENGVTHLEIAFGKYEDTVNIDFKEYKRLADKFDIKLWSFHLPFVPFTTLNPASFDETVRKFTVVYFKELMKEAKRDADINVFVIHPSGEPIHEDDRKASLNQLKKSLNELCDFAESLGVTLAVENLPRTCLGRSISDMYEILSINPLLKMCFDLNHMSNEKAEDIINRFGNKIVTLHVSDFFGNDECHLMPLEGSNNWDAVIKALIKAEYKGPFLYEISKGALEDGKIWAKEAWHTKLFVRENYLTHKDVFENYKKLMANH
ncbi:MAG: sugar phosphate isomerase/epimerase [Ruminococcaceae bacterium]|nr:sugar phosphate isomerase/epimerase [Oscillospiraceae bacterium]